MKLADLDPKLTDGYLRFRCPACREHFIVIPVSDRGSSRPPVWEVSGPLETLTVRPSIDAETKPSCRWHGFVTNGEIITC